MKKKATILMAATILMGWAGAYAEEGKGDAPARNFATVWQWQTKDRSLFDQNVSAQFDQIMELVKKGVIENIYFDAEGTQEKNDVTDFVFFVNAESEQEAGETVHRLPFYREGVARYNLYPVGVLWLDDSAKPVAK